ncbi:MAG: YkgJ family cysteine cluster protein [Sandaracinaceae bacterium]|nr:YkgJ family cysteine cluster protein [Sandaracinaceae bacterium]
MTDSDVRSLHERVERKARRLHVLHQARTQCRSGCSSCCVDELTVFEVEADEIRTSYAELLARGTPHAPGACAFLDVANACRIYEHRPYVCRTQGLPLRWIDERDDEAVELRDICPLNENGPPVEMLAEEECWTLGPFEEELATMQSVSHPELTRIPLRTLFK